MEQNMIRERSTRLSSVTQKDWLQITPAHRDLVEEFLEVNTHLSKASRKQYFSALKQFFYWVDVALDGKHISKISKRDFLRYMSYLNQHGMSSSALSFKKSVVSSLNNYIEAVVAEDEDQFKLFRNFTKGLPPIPKNYTYQKILVTKEEYKHMMEQLEMQKHFLGMAWLATAFNTGARRAEIVQFKTEMLEQDFAEKTYILSNQVRGKGKAEQGKPLTFMVNKEAYNHMRHWVDCRNFKSDYIFSLSQDPLKPDWANNFCKNILSPMLNRRINPHIFRASAITHLLESKVDIALVSKYIAHHEDISTTAIYDLRDFEEEKNEIFGV